MKAYRST